MLQSHSLFCTRLRCLSRRFFILLSKYGRFLVPALFVLWVFPQAASADHLLGQHDLQCDKIFPCPDELKQRVSFWIDVFTQYGDDTIVLHDSRHPDRVYKVIKTSAQCSRRREARSIKNAKSKLRKQILQIADKRAKGITTFSGEEKHLAELLKNDKLSEIRKAAKRIRCQGGVADQFHEALERHDEYGPMVVKTLKQAGLPTDIQYLPFVESSYRPTAYSRVGAAGMWQIMPRTARILGLKISSTVDERLDPVLASGAATRYFLDSRKKLGDKARTIKSSKKHSLYPYVITSYNYGAAGMLRAMDKVGADYMDVLNKYKARGFQTAVKNFYASFLAARHVAQNVDKYYPDHKMGQPLAMDVVTIKTAVSTDRLMTVFSVSESTLKKYNTSLMRLVWSGRRFVPRGYKLKLPKSTDGRSEQVAKLNSMRAEEPKYAEYSYRVRRGDTACGIARKESVSCRELILLNNLGRRAFIRAGQIIIIPGIPTKVAKKKVSKPAKKTVKKAEKQPVKVVLAKNKIRIEPEKQIENKQLSAVAVSPIPRRPEPVIKSIPNVPESIFGVGDDLLIQLSKKAGKIRYSIVVEPDESLGLFANWMGIRYTSRIRKMNKIKKSRKVRIGKVIYLPVKSTAQREKFNQQRLDYHRELQDEFRSRFKIPGVETYKIRIGDSAWSISIKQRVPLWLLKRYNPKLFTTQLQPGDVISLPVIERL
ncbi:MAG TPA: LysM peptidoglycan-binding domain-containing protein [Gammaproteobacteria bacterium]|nr:LysM peptidoglycan-binding domain-containing protein [Gammaproteobacteria bacterium]